VRLPGLLQNLRVTWVTAVTQGLHTFYKKVKTQYYRAIQGSIAISICFYRMKVT